MSQPSSLHKNILENLSDGVITLGFDGRIQDFNAAASGMFGLPPQDVVGKTLAEVFITIEGFDEFTETVLQAVSSRSKQKRKVLNVQTAEKSRLLTITTSLMTATNDEGEEKTVGVIAVFSDITEIKELRESELRMAETLEEKHAQLQDAYREIEASRDELRWTLKKVSATRIGATILIISLFLGVGLWTWSTSGSDDWEGGRSAGMEIDSDKELRTLVVRPAEFRTEISLKGMLQPWRLVSVTSPVDSRLERVYFEYGQEVLEGDALIDLNTEELLVKLQEAQIEYETAHKAIKELEDWENSTEMASELRSFSKTKMELDKARADLKTSEFLVQKGLIPTSQHEAQEQRYQRQLIDLEAAKQSLASTRAQGEGHQKKVAQLEFEKANKNLKLAKKNLQVTSVTAPIAGAILPLEAGDERLAEGQAVSRGDVLLTIADSGKMVAVATVDEVDVTKIEVGQAVRIWGDAFSDFMIQGTVRHVSPQSQQAQQASRRGAPPPRFEVVIELEELNEEKKAQLRIGMSCQIRIVVYHNPEALMVPVGAVHTGGGAYLVHVLDPATGAAVEKQVQLGMTSLDAVEVLTGLAVGDIVILPEN